LGVCNKKFKKKAPSQPVLAGSKGAFFIAFNHFNISSDSFLNSSDRV
jgi:hypothetical protein